ncbi:MAG: CehA/McbA family metallohydrolase [Planctomycetota bacterium]|jgi:hypothetical protein
MALTEIRGAVHVHTRFSDGTGTLEEVADAARAADLDFCIVTDHDTMEAGDGETSLRVSGVLVLVGAEISPARRGHCLALGADDVTGLRWIPDRHLLHKLHRDGADTYVAHPEGRVKPAFGINLRQWHAWEEEKFTGIEIWSYMHDWVENVRWHNILSCYRNPDSAIDGPDRRVLGLWDRLNLRRRIVGIGALDAHAVRRLFGLFVAFRYEFLFRTVLTHVLVEKWGVGEREDAEELLGALRAGRAFVSYAVAGDARGFHFGSEDGDRMGQRCDLRAGTRLFVHLPEAASITLVHNGRKAAGAEGVEAAFGVAEGGVYRVEARRRQRPWIFSNPVYYAD